MPTGKYYLGDAGYSNSQQVLVPYKSVIYHLCEIRAAGRKPTTPEELFNFRQASLRNVVERTFGVFKRRWRVFDRTHEFSVKKQAQLVYALAVIQKWMNKSYAVEEDVHCSEDGDIDRDDYDDANPR